MTKNVRMAGRDPGLTDDLVLDLAYRSTIDGFRDMTAANREGIVREENGVAVWLSPHPLPMLLNGAARIDPSVLAHDALQLAKAFFEERGRGFTFYGREGVDDDIMKAADEAGMVAMGEGAPLMAVDGPPTSIDVPSGVRLERAGTGDQVLEFADVCADAYAVYGMPADVFPSALLPEAVLGSHRALVVAYDHEGAIGGGFVIATHGCAYVCVIGVRQRAFKRGIGAAVTQAATQAGFDLGARVGTLMASPMGAPVYRRIGWRDVGVMANRLAFPPSATVG